MRLIGKFALAFLLASYACLAFYGYLAAHHEAKRLDQDASADLISLGHALRADIAKRGDAVGTISAAREAKLGVDVAYVADRRATADEVTFRDQGPDAREVSVFVPLDGTGGVRVSKIIPTERDLLFDQLQDQLFVALLMSGALVTLVVTLGAWLIGRPLDLVVAQAQRIGRGDLSLRLEETRRDEIGDLKRSLNVMTDQLEEARRLAEEATAARTEAHEQLRHMDRLRTVGTLASSLAHELGTPLNVVLIRGQSLGKGPLPPEEVASAAKTIIAQVEKMTRIVRQLLDFVRARPTERRRLSMAKVVEDSVALLGTLAKKQGVDCEVVVPNETVAVMGDDAQLEQAISNLVMNAVQAMPNGGKLTIKVRTADDLPMPQSTRSLDAACVDVIDEGPGIEKDALERIFEPFYTTKPKGEGTGLGLAVAQGIAADHGGWISAESEAGKGSTFSLVLPRTVGDA